MKINGKTMVLIVLAVLIVGLLITLTRWMGSAFQFLLGALIVLALIVLVIWMFAYANRHR